MPQFELNGKYESEFRALDEFTQGYVEAMFWTEEETLTEQAETEGLRNDGWETPGFTDLAPETLARITADCVAFQEKCKALLAVASEHRALDHLGHDFWLDRNGHGTGFWDRKELDFAPHPEHAAKLGDALSEAAKRVGSVDVYLGDDGKVYCT